MTILLNLLILFSYGEGTNNDLEEREYDRLWSPYLEKNTENSRK